MAGTKKKIVDITPSPILQEKINLKRDTDKEFAEKMELMKRQIEVIDRDIEWKISLLDKLNYYLQYGYKYLKLAFKIISLIIRGQQMFGNLKTNDGKTSALGYTLFALFLLWGLAQIFGINLPEGTLDQILETNTWSGVFTIVTGIALGFLGKFTNKPDKKEDEVDKDK